MGFDVGPAAVRSFACSSCTTVEGGTPGFAYGQQRTPYTKFHSVRNRSQQPPYDLLGLGDFRCRRCDVNHVLPPFRQELSDTDYVEMNRSRDAPVERTDMGSASHGTRRL